MPATAATPHRAIDAGPWAVPRPFRSLAVRSEEPRHALLARAPYPRVHLLRPPALDAAALARLAALGRSRMTVAESLDIAYAPVGWDELDAALPPGPGLLDTLAAALQATGVLGDGLGAYRQAVADRIDFLASRGAGFHNDISRHWTACLFWNLTLAAADVEFVLPHGGLRLALQPGDLIVFDPVVAHGLCRPGDQGQAVAASFDPDDAGAAQVFLSGELPLSDVQWAALGAPWTPVEAHAQRGALDLWAAEFDACSGAVQGVRGLVGCMDPAVRYDEGVADACIYGLHR